MMMTDYEKVNIIITIKLISSSIQYTIITPLLVQRAYFIYH